MDSDVQPGRSYPLGATVLPDGVNFSVFSKNCEALELLFFDDAHDERPSRVIKLDPARNKTFYYWHAFVPALKEGQLYGFRAHGPFAPEKGHRFDGQKVLLDPYARSVVFGSHYDRDAATGPGDNCARCPKGVVLDPGRYDWEDDIPLRRPFAETVIYELHVRGFTRHPSSGLAADRRGTYAGLVEKIPYLQELGVTAVELLPVQQYDEHDAPLGHRNYWGFSPIAFFAPHRAYSRDQGRFGPVNEFREMVKALHRAGIEVILDVVFNHTSEGDEQGPTLCFRGLENTAYYILEPDPALYANYSGCGNTFNSNHSIVRRLILDCLRYWVAEMHVDGFRFDLASVMSRDERGQPLEDPPILWSIESDPVLAGTKIIAEAWDAGGLYQVGSFIGDRFAEWNGKYRDDVRRFVKGDPGVVPDLMARIMGSPDLYRSPDRDPHRSINFITCHDGFTQNDLVSYNTKHNAANGEDNRDGADDNHSWNCGAEGDSDDPVIQALRRRQIKNFYTILLMSHGTPMLQMGDEIRLSHQGNNNTYCQDNELNWFDWQSLDREGDLLRFVRRLIDFHRSLLLFRQGSFWSPNGRRRGASITWYGEDGRKPDPERSPHCIAYRLRHQAGGEDLYAMLNSYWKPLDFRLPRPRPGWRWHRVIDTALAFPRDIEHPAPVPLPADDTYRLESRSTVILKALPAR